MTVLPVHNYILVPDSIVFFQTDYFAKMTGKLPMAEEKLILLVMKESFSRDELKKDSFYPVALSAVVSEVNNNGYFLCRTLERVRVESISVFKDKTVDVTVSRLSSIEDEDPAEEKRHLKEIKNAIVQFADSVQWGAGLRGYLAEWDTVARIASTLSPWFYNSNDERYAILYEDSVAKRNRLMEGMILENLEVLKVNTEARNAQKEEYEKIYRENAIKKQIAYLQEELDELNPDSVSDIRSLEIKINESGMNEAARREADKVLKRLKQENGSSSESAMLHDYLDFVTSLPWKKETREPISLDHAIKVLNKDHFGLDKIKRRITEQIAVMTLKGEQSGSILCFVGAPGTGKTSIGASIAEAMGRKYIRISLGGVRDEADIRGHRRTYVGAMPGRILSGIERAGVTNPVVVLDEVDKLASSYNGDPSAALLEVLDPEQNHSFTDHYMNVPYDLSDCFFICTANSLETIPEPLLNRMEVLDFEGYTPSEKVMIAKDHLIPKAMEAAGVSKTDLTITKPAVDLLISDYTREAGVRGLKKRIDNICRRAAVNIIEDGEKRTRKRREPLKQRVTKDNLKEYVEGKPLLDKNVKAKTAPGIITGLAWTAGGGDILYIETMFTKGSGETVITGRLGDVMTESAKVAISLVKNLFPDKAELFKENTLHIHVPDGATPKDGPSAGITLTTALSSLVTGKSVTPRVAMTGEVTLRGEVGAIGGLPQKLMAAHRSGVKTVFIPKDNLRDLEDVPAEVRDALKIIPVKRAEEVLKELGIR